MGHWKYYVLTLILISSFFVNPNLAHSQIPLTVTVDHPYYHEGETAAITGTVPHVVEGAWVVIQIFNPRMAVYALDQVAPRADGTYFTTVRLGGNLAAVGVYIVKVTYLGQTAQTTFEYRGEVVEEEPTFQIMQVIAGEQTFDVIVSLTNGSVQSVELDVGFKSLIVFVQTDRPDIGTLEITLPRELIDARGGDGQTGPDIPFRVIIDSRTAQFVEKNATVTSRILEISVPPGANQIEIDGTVVVPEFGFVAVLVLAATIGTIIVIQRMTQKKDGSLLVLRPQ